MRLRFNDLAGKLTTGISSGAVTFSSAALASLGTVASPDVVVVVFNPSLDASKATSYEIAYITAHTASATTATILRGQEGTSGIAFATDTIWEHASTVRDYYAVRPFAFFNG